MPSLPEAFTEAFSRSCLMSVPTTIAPSSLKALTVACPIAPPAPVTRQTLFCKRFIFLSSDHVSMIEPIPNNGTAYRCHQCALALSSSSCHESGGTSDVNNLALSLELDALGEHLVEVCFVESKHASTLSSLLSRSRTRGLCSDHTRWQSPPLNM